MRNTMLKKILAQLVAFSLILQQAGFAQGLGQLDITRYMNQSGAFSRPDKFRPSQLRYFSYDPLRDNFRILLDKGDLKKIKDTQIKEQGQELLKYFLIGVSLPDEKFWVNLRPDSEDQIIDPELARTEMGKVLLEADLQLKKDLAGFTSPQAPQGREYWNKLYQKAKQIFGSENVTIPTITRPWIVPNEVIIRQTANSAYIYKATLRVMLEQDYLKNSVDYNFSDPRQKELNEYSSQLIREKIIPNLIQKVNSSAKYAALRQVFSSLILSRWFKNNFSGKSGQYSGLINSGNLNGLTSKTAWSKTTYFKEYQKSFASGEYNLKEQVNTLLGPTIRTYTSGGVTFYLQMQMPKKLNPDSAIAIFSGNNAQVSSAIENGMVPLTGTPGVGQIIPTLTLAEGAASPAGEASKVTMVVSPQTGKAGSPLQIRTELKVPEGQPKGFFTTDYQSYTIDELFVKPVEQIPDAVVNAVRKKLNEYIAAGKLLGARVADFAGTDIDILVTHRYGELNSAVQQLILEAMKDGVLKAKELGLLRKEIDVNSMGLADFIKSLRVKYQPHSITERGAEPVMIAKIIGAGIGAANIKLYHEFFIPGATPLQKLGFVPEVPEKGKLGVRGFRAIVRRIEDVLKGNFAGPVWEFEKSSAFKVGDKQYASKDESLELLAFAGQPNDFIITAIYPVEGSLLPSTEPVVSVVYQPVYGEKGELRTLNPTFICRSQSGADAVAGVASMFYDVNFVPGGPNGENYVVTKPATLKEARKAPKEGTANVVVYGWMSKGDGVIPQEKDGVIDHVAINPPAFSPEKKLADFLASIMATHQYDQPYLAPFVTEERVKPIREAQSGLFKRAPKEADIDPFMDEVEAKVADGTFLSVTDDKADMGGKLGHNFPPEYMLAIDLATAMEAKENGLLSDGNIIGFLNKTRLKNGTTVAIGDDSHILMLGDKSRNSAQAHQLSFLAFTRGYLAAVVNGEKPYGLAQDYQGKEAKSAKAHPYYYSHFTGRFFEILRTVMPLDYMGMVNKMYDGWKAWEKIHAETITLPEPFSGNVSQQGIGSARYLVDIAGGERDFGVLAGDKMGPAALNRPIREGVYAALEAGEFKNGLVFEIWDAKAFDEHGKIPLDKLPGLYADVADAITSLKEQSDQDFVNGSYTENGLLRDNLGAAEKERLADLLKKAGYVPTERIFLDAQKDKDAIYLYLADSDRFNIKQVWVKKEAGWDINYPKLYLNRPILGSSVTKLGILAGGEYVGKDDPVMVGNMKLMKYIFEFFKGNPLIIQGDMNGSHWLAAIPTAFKNAVANKESHPILIGFKYTLSEDGKTSADVEDIFKNKDYRGIRQRMFEFNFKFKQAQLGGQFEPYGTNWRTVEASYPLAKLLRVIQSPKSPFLVKNKPEAERPSKPIGALGETIDLFNAVTASSAVEVKRTPVVGGNWKLRPFANEEAARAKAKEFKAKLAPLGDKANIVIFVEDRWMKVISEELVESNIAVGVQSFHFNPETDINQQIQDAVNNGAKYAMVGHSMHRSPDPKILSGVAPLTNDGANKIAREILRDGRLKLWYVVAVDEDPNPDISLPVKESFFKKQITEGINIGLEGITKEQLSNVIITVEPMRDISTKTGDGKIDPMTKVNIPKVDMLAELLTQAISNKFGEDSQVNTGYGASAGPDTAEILLSHKKVFNILPGGKSLEANDFYETINNGIKGKASSSLAEANIPLKTALNDGFGGINFRVIPMLTRPMGNLSGLELSLPKRSNLASINLDQELTQIKNMLWADITPSADRLKEYVAACYQKGELKQHLEGVVSSAVAICRLEEEKAQPSSNELKEVLLILDAIS